MPGQVNNRSGAYVVDKQVDPIGTLFAINKRSIGREPCLDFFMGSNLFWGSTWKRV